jgi:hypothetical protein
VKLEKSSAKIEFSSDELNDLKSLTRSILSSYNFGFSDEIQLSTREWALLNKFKSLLE